MVCYLRGARDIQEGVKTEEREGMVETEEYLRVCYFEAKILGANFENQI